MHPSGGRVDIVVAPATARRVLGNWFGHVLTDPSSATMPGLHFLKHK